MSTVYFSLGANIGNREYTLKQAIQLMEQRIGTLIRCSSFYYSEPWGFKSEHMFCNICASFLTDCSPEQLLNETQDIERYLGRTYKSTSSTPNYQDRTIDIDILLYFDHNNREVSYQSPTLTIPHPLMHERDFVRIPLQQIFP